MQVLCGKYKYEGNIRHEFMFWKDEDKYECNIRHESKFWMEKDKHESNTRHANILNLKKKNMNAI